MFVAEDQIIEVKSAVRLHADCTYRIVKYNKEYAMLLTLFYRAKRGKKSMAMPAGFALIKGKHTDDYSVVFQRFKGYNSSYLPTCYVF